MAGRTRLREPGRRAAGVAAAVRVILLGAATMMAACSDTSKPYVVIEGGGFIFNYRVAEAFYGVSLRPMRHLDPGTVLEVLFENPAGGPPFVVRDTVVGNRLTYAMRTPGLKGVKKDHPYQVEVRVRAPKTGKILATYTKDFKSDVDQSVLPEKPLTIGPGYTRNPELVKRQ